MDINPPPFYQGSTLSLTIAQYSGGSNSEHSNTEYIRKPNVLKFGFQMADAAILFFLPFENQTFYHSKTELFKMAALAKVVFLKKKIFFYYTKWVA